MGIAVIFYWSAPPSLTWTPIYGGLQHSAVEHIYDVTENAFPLVGSLSRSMAVLLLWCELTAGEDHYQSLEHKPCYPYLISYIPLLCLNRNSMLPDAAIFQYFIQMLRIQIDSSPSIVQLMIIEIWYWKRNQSSVVSKLPRTIFFNPYFKICAALSAKPLEAGWYSAICMCLMLLRF